jgi:hypothetical protein
MAKKLEIFSLRRAAIPLRDIAGDGDGRAAKLICEAEALGVWERGGQLVDRQR